MKTLTITEARKNLGAWLRAAAHGEDIAIVSGADIIALRKVTVEASDYAQSEYRASESDVARLDRATGARYQHLARARKLVTLSPGDLGKLLE